MQTPEQMREDAREAYELAKARQVLGEEKVRQGRLVDADCHFRRGELYDRLASYAEELAALREGPQYIVRARDQFCTQYYLGTKDRYYVDDPAEAKHFTNRDWAEFTAASERARVPSRQGQLFEVEVIELTALLAEGKKDEGQV